MRVVGIVQARMGSSRLPGKVLRTVSGVALLEYQLRRVSAARELSGLIVATSLSEKDEPIASLCRNLNVGIFRGSEHDVLERYYLAAHEARADVVVRLTADCPLIDPSLIDQVIRAFRSMSPSFDYYSNTLDRGFPRGMDVEVMTFDALRRAHFGATDNDEREHVTLHLYRRPHDFRIGSYEYRLTVDTPADFERMQKMIEDLQPTSTAPTLAELTAWLQYNPPIT